MFFWQIGLVEFFFSKHNYWRFYSLENIFSCLSSEIWLLDKSTYTNLLHIPSSPTVSIILLQTIILSSLTQPSTPFIDLNLFDDKSNSFKYVNFPTSSIFSIELHFKWSTYKLTNISMPLSEDRHYFCECMILTVFIFYFEGTVEQT